MDLQKELLVPLNSNNQSTVKKKKTYEELAWKVLIIVTYVKLWNKEGTGDGSWQTEGLSFWCISFKYLN